MLRLEMELNLPKNWMKSVALCASILLQLATPSLAFPNVISIKLENETVPTKQDERGREGESHTEQFPSAMP